MSQAKRLWTYQEVRRRFLDSAVSELRFGGEEEAHRLAQELWCLAGSCTRTQLLTGNSFEATSEQLKCFNDYVARAVKGESLAYIEGCVGFYGLEFLVTPAVLVPRCDSECLVEWALELLTDKTNPRILDMGTGSGCLLLSILHNHPSAVGVGVDLSNQALVVAQQNSVDLNVSERVEFIQSDWFEELPTTPQYDLILSNTPYIEPSEQTGFGVRDYEPSLALFSPAGDPFECYKKIIAGAASHLNDAGELLFEVGINRAPELSDLLQRNGFQNLRVRKDLGGVERAVYACLPASI